MINFGLALCSLLKNRGISAVAVPTPALGIDPMTALRAV